MERWYDLERWWERNDAYWDSRRKLVLVDTPCDASNPWDFVRAVQYGILCNVFANYKYGNTWAPMQHNTRLVLYGMSGFRHHGVAAWWRRHMSHAGHTYVFNKAGLSAAIRPVVREAKVDAVVLFKDMGVTKRMHKTALCAQAHNTEVIYDTLPPSLMQHVLGESVASTLVPVAMFLAFAVPFALGTRQIVRGVRRAPTAWRKLEERMQAVGRRR